MSDSIPENVVSAKILVVGAGGIGCELLKNLVLTGFSDIHVIDLDTIDVSNLNRQFLFQKQHVGKSKAQVAAESVRRFAPSANIVALHSSIMNHEYGMDFFKQFDIVLNALDNRAARNHVNRMCLSANIPLVESGSAGYLGQVSVIKKGVTECYECNPKPAQKSYPGCTIRNTPSEPIHCIVWAKHLFNQLFGEADIDEDVSPDMEDPELQVNGNSTKEENGVTETNGVSAAGKTAENGVQQRISTRRWAEDHGYNPETLFNKLFRDDIEYLLTMENLWKKRRAPTPLDWNNLSDIVPGSSKVTESVGIKDQEVWSPAKCRDVFVSCVASLKEALSKKENEAVLIWDKDEDLGMDFVTCCANIRSFIFGIQMKSRFEIKSMAGNIIPAIATTNAVVAAMIVMEALKILMGNIDMCKAMYIVKKPNARGKILSDTLLYPPNPKCYVCSEKPEVAVELNTKTFTVKSLEEKILKQTLNMVAPDVNLVDGTGSVIISSEEGETVELEGKPLAEVRVVNGTRLMCDDFMQHYELLLVIHQTESLPHDEEFRLITDTSNLKAEPLKEHDHHKDKTNLSTDVVEIVSPSKVKVAQKRSADDGVTEVEVKRVKVA